MPGENEYYVEKERRYIYIPERKKRAPGISEEIVSALSRNAPNKKETQRIPSFLSRPLLLYRDAIV